MSGRGSTPVAASTRPTASSVASNAHSLTCISRPAGRERAAAVGAEQLAQRGVEAAHTPQRDGGLAGRATLQPGEVPILPVGEDEPLLARPRRRRRAADAASDRNVRLRVEVGALECAAQRREHEVGLRGAALEDAVAAVEPGVRRERQRVQPERCALPRAGAPRAPRVRKEDRAKRRGRRRRRQPNLRHNGVGGLSGEAPAPRVRGARCRRGTAAHHRCEEQLLRARALQMHQAEGVQHAGLVDHVRPPRPPAERRRPARAVALIVPERPAAAAVVGGGWRGARGGVVHELRAAERATVTTYSAAQSAACAPYGCAASAILRRGE